MAMPTTGMAAEITATVTTLVRAWPSTSMNAPTPMPPPPISTPLPHCAARSAAPPSSHHHSGSKHAAAMAMRAAVSGSAGTLPISRSAAGSPSAHTSMDSMHKTLDRARLGGVRKSGHAL